MGKRIRGLRTARDLTQSDLARAAEVDTSTVSRWEQDKQEPRIDQVRRLADIFNMSMDELTSESVRPIGAGIVSSRMIPVVGELQAGDWREAIEWSHDDQFTVPAYLPDGLRHMEVIGYKVMGNSMNRLYPHGSIVFAASTITNGLMPKSGNKVIVQRRDRNGLYEVTLKEYVVEADGTKWLWPRSSDPEHQAPIQYRNSTNEEVTITGVVVLSQVNELNR